MKETKLATIPFTKTYKFYPQAWVEVSREMKILRANDIRSEDEFNIVEEAFAEQFSQYQIQSAAFVDKWGEDHPFPAAVITLEDATLPEDWDWKSGGPVAEVSVPTELVVKAIYYCPKCCTPVDLFVDEKHGLEYGEDTLDAVVDSLCNLLGPGARDFRADYEDVVNAYRFFTFCICNIDTKSIVTKSARDRTALNLMFISRGIDPGIEVEVDVFNILTEHNPSMIWVNDAGHTVKVGRFELEHESYLQITENPSDDTYCEEPFEPVMSLLAEMGISFRDTEIKHCHSSTDGRMLLVPLLARQKTPMIPCLESQSA